MFFPTNLEKLLKSIKKGGRLYQKNFLNWTKESELSYFVNKVIRRFLAALVDHQQPL